MPVVINDFEVTTENEAPPASGGADNAKKDKGEEKPDLEGNLHLLHERHQRVWAH
jgi:hypothetical protein